MTLDELRALPKVELHCHLEGALHLETLWERAQKYEAERFKSFEEFKAASTVEKGTTPGFKPFLDKFNALRFHYGNSDELSQVIFWSMWDLAVSDHLVSFREIRFSPVFFARRMLKGDAALAPQIPISLVEEAAAIVIETAAHIVYMLTDQPVEFIVTCSRHFGYEINKPALELLHRPIGKKIKGLDLAGDESLDSTEFIRPFLEWKEAGKMITIHAGEDINAGGPRNIIEALDVFKADRIGHGVRAIEDPELVARLVREQVPLEMCPTSNLQTRAVPNEASHPLKRLVDAGVCVTLSTDDPTICGSTMSNEYAMAMRLGLTLADLKRCTENALRASVFDDGKKEGLAEYIDIAWEKYLK